MCDFSLRECTMEKATAEQKELAKKLGIDVLADTSIIAAAKIESAVYEAVYPGEGIAL